MYEKQHVESYVSKFTAQLKDRMYKIFSLVSQLLKNASLICIYEELIGRYNNQPAEHAITH